MEHEQTKLVLGEMGTMQFEMNRDSFEDAANWIKDKIQGQFGPIVVVGYGFYQFKDQPGSTLTVLFDYE